MKFLYCTDESANSSGYLFYFHLLILVYGNYSRCGLDFFSKLGILKERVPGQTRTFNEANNLVLT